MKRILILTVMLALVLAAVAVPASAGGTTLYVKTGDGGPVNVRNAPNRGAYSMGQVKYGDSVTIDPGFVGSDWTAVVYGDSIGYVMSRFLVSEKPAPFTPSPDPSPKKDSDTDVKAYSSVDKLNTIVAGARFVEPYEITVRPVRASGWVYLRWFPTRNAKEVATYGDGKILRVIAELKDWFQVEDPDSGRTGFLYTSYIR